MSVPDWTIPVCIAIAVVVSSIVGVHDVHVRGNYSNSHFTTTNKNWEVCKLHSANMHLTCNRVPIKTNTYIREYWSLFNIGDAEAMTSLFINTEMISIDMSLSHSCSTQ